MHDVFIHPSGQDDNLGDSALRAGLLTALRNDNYRFHVHLDGQTSDYFSGLPITARDTLYPARRDWVRALQESQRPVYLLNAGEVNPQPGRTFPSPNPIKEMRRVRERSGIVIATGIGLKNPTTATHVSFDTALRDADVMTWRDHVSRGAAGFGGSAPDWAFLLGSASADWLGQEQRSLIAVTLRFDRPWPGDVWLAAVRALADRTSTRIVTVAQVARDAPRAVRLAHALGGEYLASKTTRHDDLDAHVRSVYARSLAVVSDRAHALIMGATEGAYPLGSATDPNKIRRLLDVAGIGELTGDLSGFAMRAADLNTKLPTLPRAIDSARQDLSALANHIHGAISTTVGLSRGATVATKSLIR